MGTSLTRRQEALAAQAIEKMGGQEKLRALVAKAVRKAVGTTNKIGVAPGGVLPDPLPNSTPTTDWSAWSAQDEAAMLNGTRSGPLTSVVGAALRNDAVTRSVRVDSNARLSIDADVGEASGGLTSFKSRPITRAEIEACTQKNAAAEQSVIGVMRAQRLKAQGKL